MHPSEILQLAGFALSLLGMLGVLALLVLNSKVSAAVAQAESKNQVSLALVQLEVAGLRTEIAKEQAALYREVMKSIQESGKEQSGLYKEVLVNMQNLYVNKTESERMHSDNKQRLEGIETRQAKMEEMLRTSKHYGGM
jgi:hypothetical protein